MIRFLDSLSQKIFPLASSSTFVFNGSFCLLYFSGIFSLPEQTGVKRIRTSNVNYLELVVWSANDRNSGELPKQLQRGKACSAL